MRTRAYREYLVCVKRYILATRKLVDGCGYYPRKSVYSDFVLLVLFSKAIRVSEAVCTLLEAGFEEEAFGVSRTLVDLVFTIRYIVNNEMETRARLYFKFYAKDLLEWVEIIKEYYPAMPVPSRRSMEKLSATAMPYRSPHRWAGEQMTAYKMATEPDTVEKDDLGNPATLKFIYRSMFRWTSHFVHPTIAALNSHFVQPGEERFRVHSRKAKEQTRFRRLSPHIVVTSLGLITTVFFRGMGDPCPDRCGAHATALMNAGRSVEG